MVETLRARGFLVLATSSSCPEEESSSESSINSITSFSFVLTNFFGLDVDAVDDLGFFAAFVFVFGFVAVAFGFALVAFFFFEIAFFEELDGEAVETLFFFFFEFVSTQPSLSATTVAFRFFVTGLGTGNLMNALSDVINFLAFCVH